MSIKFEWSPRKARSNVRKHGIDFDRGLSAAQKGTAWAVEKMLEDQLYWVIVNGRWLDDENFNKGPAMFFAAAPSDSAAQTPADVDQQTVYRQRPTLAGSEMVPVGPAEIKPGLAYNYYNRRLGAGAGIAQQW